MIFLTVMKIVQLIQKAANLVTPEKIMLVSQYVRKEKSLFVAQDRTEDRVLEIAKRTLASVKGAFLKTLVL